MDRVRQTVHAQEAYRKGILGQGITVAVLDTGLAPHPDFGGRIAGFRDFLHRKNQCYDDSSHGTHVCGILGGDGKLSGGRYAGIAPACRLLPVKVLDERGNGMREDVEKGIAWVIQNKEKYDIRIMNISVGTVKEDEDLDQTMLDAVERAWDSGIVVVVAGGNMGPAPMSITVPGNSRKVITVGASDDCSLPGGKSDVRPCYSGRGPTRECVCKPDICAPGSGIIACSGKPIRGKLLYQVKSGTSMATPVVSGAIALLLAARPELTNVEVKMRLKETAEDIGLDRNQQGWGRLHIGRLLAF
ncbi:MAG: S8 family peptidase [Candidatus Limivivens sp.]|nr:S8 family peptidase [Candidatus Limivivens sp.]